MTRSCKGARCRSPWCAPGWQTCRLRGTALLRGGLQISSLRRLLSRSGSERRLHGALERALEVRGCESLRPVLEVVELDLLGFALGRDVLVRACELELQPGFPHAVLPLASDRAPVVEVAVLWFGGWGVAR